MSHRETRGNLVVDEGNEHPSKLNMEGQNAQHTSAAGNALPEAGPSRSRSDSNSNSVSHRDGDEDEKKDVGGDSKPQMEKYAYHSMSPFSSPPFLSSSLSQTILSRWNERGDDQDEGAGSYQKCTLTDQQYSHPKWPVYEK